MGQHTLEAASSAANTRQIMRQLNDSTPGVPKPGEPQLDLLEDERKPGRANGALLQLRAEFDGYRRQMCGFSGMEPDEVLMYLSAYTARATEVRVQLWRDGSRAAAKMRTEELDPFVEECERQFKYASRSQAIRDFDLKMTRGAPS